MGTVATILTAVWTFYHLKYAYLERKVVHKICIATYTISSGSEHGEGIVTYHILDHMYGCILRSTNKKGLLVL